MNRFAFALLVALAGCGPSDTEQADACAKGPAQSETTTDQCKFTTAGRCFQDAATACLCAGCFEDQCAIQESYPAVPACN